MCLNRLFHADRIYQGQEEAQRVCAGTSFNLLKAGVEAASRPSGVQPRLRMSVNSELAFLVG